MGEEGAGEILVNSVQSLKTKEPCRIYHGTKFKIGNCEFSFEIENELNIPNPLSESTLSESPSYSNL